MNFARSKERANHYGRRSWHPRRRCDKQRARFRALFNRRLVDIFPPPGPDRRNSFFAETLPSSESNARLYVGVAAQGRSPKVAMLRVYLALLGAAEKWQY